MFYILIPWTLEDSELVLPSNRQTQDVGTWALQIVVGTLLAGLLWGGGAPTELRANPFTSESEGSDPVLFSDLWSGEGEETLGSFSATNYALQFDGTDDVVEVGSANDINTSSHDRRTIEAWFQVDDASIDGRKQVIWEEGGTGDGFNLYVYDGRLYVGAWSESNGWSGTWLQTEAIQSGTWHHVALVYDAPRGSFRGYLDGSEFGSTSAPVTISSHGDAIGLGAAQSHTKFEDSGDFGGSGRSHHFAGMIDEVRIWNGGRTKEEIQNDRFSALSGDETALVAYWQFDEGSGSTAADATGNGHEGTLDDPSWMEVQLPAASAPLFTSLSVTEGVVGQSYQYDVTVNDLDGDNANLTLRAPTLPSWLSFSDDGSGSGTLSGAPASSDVGTHSVVLEAEDADGNVAQQTFEVNVVSNYALQFDGTDDDVAVGNADDINTSNHDRRTIAAWFKVDDKSVSSRKQVIYEEGGGTNGFNLYVFDGRLYVGAWSGSNGWSGTWLRTDDVQSGTWHHVALVFDHPNSVMKGYFDGVEFGSAAAPVTMNAHSGKIGIGAVRRDTKFQDSGNFGGSGQRFGGTIDEVSIWNAARTQSEIREDLFVSLSGRKTDLVAYWPFNEGSGTATADAALSHEGTLNGPTWTQTQFPSEVRPVFASTPVTNATVGQAYRYDVIADDADEDNANLTLRAPTLPSWLSFRDEGAGRGTLSGIPISGDVGSHSVVLEVEDADGNLRTQSFEVSVRDGLRGEYFDGYYDDNFSFFDAATPVHTRTDAPIDFGDSGSWNLDGTVLSDLDDFSIRWTGYIDIPQDGTYTFYTDSDDASYVFFDGAVDTPTQSNATVSNGGTHGTQERSGSITLSSGWHRVLIVYGEAGGGEAMRFRWSSNDAGISKEIVPASVLSRKGTQPVFTTTPEANVSAGEAYQYDVSVADPDGDDANLTLQAVTTPSWLTFTDDQDGTGTLSGTPAGGDQGVHRVELEATDEAGETRTQSFRVGVTAPVPTALPTDGLQLFLDAASLQNLSDGSPVQTWFDGTGQPFNALQRISERRPNFVTSGIDGKPVVRFDASDDNLTLGSNYIFSDRDGVTVFAVLASSEDTQIPLFYDFGHLAGENYGFSYDTNTAGVSTPKNHGGEADPNTGVHSVGSGVPVVFTGEIRFGQEQRVRINGGPPLFSSSISTSQLTANEIRELPVRGSGGPVTIGQQSKTGNESGRKFAGDMAELIVYDRALTDAERQQVEQHLASKYSINQTPLSGTFTIGSNGDFATFSDATTALSARGVDGAVTFEVTSGTYAEQVTIPTIPGASASNTVTFRSQSGTASDVVLEAETGTLIFEKAAHVRVEAMTLSATRESDNNPVRPVVLKREVEDVRLVDNVIKGYDGTQETGQVLVYGDRVVMTDIQVEGNRFVDTETGVWLRGNEATGTAIRGNVFENVDRRGIFLRDQTAPQVLGNRVRSGQIGIELRNSGGSDGNEALVANNMVVVSSTGDGNGRGLYVNGSGNVQVYHNAVNVIDSDPANQAFLQNGSTSGLDVKNNVFAAPGGGRAIRIDDPSSNLAFDFNDLYTTGNVPVQWGSTSYTTLSDYRSGTGEGANSIDVDPGYATGTDLAPTSAQLSEAGTDLTSTVSQDISGTSRTVPVSMGAVEFEAQVPSFTSTPVRTVSLGESYQYAVTAEDPDGDEANVTLRATTLPSWLSFTDEGSGSGTLAGTPSEGDAGVHSVVLEAEDADGNTTAQSFEVATGNLALTFDGTDDHVAVPDAPEINTSSRDVRTIEAWFQVDDASISGRKQVVYEEGGTGNGFNLYVYDGRLYVGAWSESNGWNGTWLRTDAIESGTWHHAALVFDRPSGTFTGYLDGDEIGRRAAPTAMSEHGGDIGIGMARNTSKFHDGDFGGDGHEFGGGIDEIRIWNGVRSPSDIRENRVATLSGNETDLEAYWPIEQGTPNVVFDATGNGHDGDLRGSQRTVSGVPFGGALFASDPPLSVDVGTSYSYSVTVNDTDGDDANLTLRAPTLPSWLSFSDGGSGNGTLSGSPSESEAGVHTVVLEAEDGDGNTTTQSIEIGVGNLMLSLDGSDDQVATTLDIDQSGSTPITMEAWVYPASSSGGRQQVISSNDQGADWSILRDGGTWHVYTGETSVSTGLRVETDAWQHVAAVFVPGTGVRFYKDGQEVVLSSIGTDQNDHPIHIGVNPGNSQERFAGRVEDVRVWNVERTAAEIETARSGPLTGQESGLVGYWPLEDKTRTLLLDASGNGNHGTVRGAQREVSDVPFGHPKFTSAPVLNVGIDEAYQYDLVATDTDAGDAGLTLRATTLPQWLSFTDQGSGQGVVSGTPEFTDTGTHVVEVEATDADGQTATQRYVLVVGSFTKQGLLGRYYDGYYDDDHSFFDGKTEEFSRVDAPIDFEDTDESWGFDGTALADRGTYSVSWSGFVDIPATGVYTFYTASDDASYLFLGEATLNPTTQNATVRNGGTHGTNEESGKAFLTEGLHPIRVHYGESSGGDDIEVAWASSAVGVSKQVIPPSALRTRGGREVTDGGVCSPGDVTFRWDAVSGANAYRLDVATAPQASDIVETVELGSETSYTFTEGQGGTTYFARVAPSSDGGDTFDEPSGFSDGITVDRSAPQIQVPRGTARKDETIRFGISGSDNVNWTESQVQVDTDPTFPSPIVDETVEAGEPLTVDATPGTVLYARAKAIDCAGNESDFSGASKGVFAKFAPVSLQSPDNGADDTAIDGLDLTWADVSEASAYWLQVATDGGFDNLIADERQLAATSHTLDGLNTATTYYWRVAARNEEGVGFFSDTRKFTTKPAVPEVATLSAPADGDTKIKVRAPLQWNALSDASSYHVQVATDESFSSPVFENQDVGGTDITTDRLDTQTTYFWRVRGKSSAGTGDWSALRSFTTETLSDLRVTSTSPPPSASSGEVIEVEWTVNNDGDGPTPGQWKDAIFLSSLPSFDSDAARRLGTVRNLTSLNAEQSYTATAEVRLPQGIQGDRYLFVKADHRNNQREHDESNNRSGGAQFNVNLTPPPDLQVTSLNAPSAAFSDETIQVDWTVENLGSGITRAEQWADGVYLSDDQTLDPSSDRRLDAQGHEGRLDVGGSYEGTTDVHLPLDVNGTFFVLVRTDDGDGVFEHTSEENNVYDTSSEEALEITLTPPADLSVESVNISTSKKSDPFEVLSGEKVNVSWTVENVGANATSSDKWPDRVYLSEESTLDKEEAQLLTSVQHRGTLEKDAQYTVEREIRLPNDLSGTRHIFVETDAGDAVFEHTFEDNNAQSGPDPLEVELRPFADLQVQGIERLNSATAGETLRVRWTVKNEGTASAAVWTDGVAIAPSDNLNARSQLLNPRNKASLAPGETYTQTADVPLPADISGLHTLFVQTDAGNVIFEHTADGNNTTQSANFDVEGAPPADLVARELSVPSTGKSGQDVTIDWTVENQGTGRTKRDAWDDVLYLSPKNEVSTANATRLERIQRRNALDSDEQYSRSRTVSLPNGISGTFYVVLAADDRDQVEDADRSNNVRISKEITVELTPPPDLQVTGLQAPTGTASGQPFTVQWTAQNAGSGAAPSDWFDALYLSTDPVLSDSDQKLAAQRRESDVAAGDSYTKEVELRVPHSTAGQHYLIARTDQRDEVFEYESEDNNTTTAAIDFTPQPPTELAVKSVNPPAEAASGEPASIEWTLKNDGENAATGNVVDGVYVSEDAEWQVDDPLVTLHTHEIDIAAGSEKRVQMEANLAKAFKADASGNIQEPLPGVPPGDYHVIVRTDVRDYMAETNERNNVGASPKGEDPVGSELMSVSVPKISLGQSTQIQLRTGERRYYRFEVPSQSDDEKPDLVLRLAASEGFNEMYHRHGPRGTDVENTDLTVDSDSPGPMPSRSQFDHKHNNPLAPSQTIRVSDADPGRHFLLVRGENLPSGGIQATLEARIPDFEVAALDGPQRIGNDGRVSLGVDGSNFDTGSELVLHDPATGNTIRAEKNTVLNSTRMNGRFQMDGEPLGDYELMVERPDGKQATLEQSVEVEPTRRRPPEVTVASPSSIRPGQESTFHIQVRNPGNVNNEFFVTWLILPDLVDVIFPFPSPPYFSPPGEDAPEGPISPDDMPDFGDPLPPLDEGPPPALPGVGVPFDEGETGYPVEFHNLPPDQPISIPVPSRIPPGERGSGDEKVCDDQGPNSLTDDLFDRAQDLKRRRERIGKAAKKLGEVGEHAGKAIYRDAPKTFFNPKKGVKDLIKNTYSALKSMKEALEVGTGNREEDGEDCSPLNVPVSQDPNDIVGPAGAGDQSWVAPGQPLSYKVRFENDPERATAPAQEVRIDLPLDPALDLRTIELGEVNFGDFTFSVPPAEASHTSRRIDLRESKGFFVDVTAGLDVVNNRAFWLIETVDPATGQAPDDPQTGFLPVNDETGRGQGHVTFSVEPSSNAQKSALPTGDMIEEQARIIFDTNDPIDTNVHTNTVDASRPASEVKSLPESTSDPSFSVEWSGQDPSGSGIQSYDVFVSKDGAPFEPWITNTTATSATFDGETGHTYRFYSLARDAAGNLEEDETNSEASIRTGQILNVFPGDTNNDGVVNQNDILSIGTYYGLEGPTHELKDGFEAAPVSPWSPEAATFADANGDGKINQNDVLPIGTHYGKSHAKSKEDPNGPEGPITRIQVRPLPEGTTVPLYLRVSAEDEPLRNVLGTAAALKVPPEIFSVKSVEATSVLGEDLISFQNHDEERGRLDVAYTRRGPDGPASPLADTTVVKVVLRVDGPMAGHGKIALVDAETSLMRGASSSTGKPPLRLTSPYAEQAPSEYALRQNYPNPAAQRSTIRFALPEAEPVTLEIYDILGRRVASVKRKEKMKPGWHAVQVDASRLASGTYFYRLQAGDFQKIRKMVVLR